VIHVRGYNVWDSERHYIRNPRMEMVVEYIIPQKRKISAFLFLKCVLMKPLMSNVHGYYIKVENVAC